MTIPDGSMAAAQAAVLRFAGRVFLEEADHALLANLRTHGRGGGMSTAWPEPLLTEDQLQAADHTVLDELATEFCRLFIGPGPTCPPYLSVYSSDRLAGRTERGVREFAAGRGLQLPDPARWRLISHDHVGIVLAVLVALHAPGREADRHTFEIDVVGDSLSRFGDAVARRAAPGLYRAAGHSLTAALAQ